MYDNTEAMTDLGYGMICDNLSRQASDVGMYWLRLAAESGSLHAAALIGYVKQFDHTYQYDPDGCRSILQREADSGNHFAQWFLGDMMYHGRSPFEEDRITGIYYIRKAAEQGNSYALAFLEQREVTPSVWGIWKMIISSFLHP